MSAATKEINLGSWEARAKANQFSLGIWILAFLPLLWFFLAWSWHRPAYQFFPMALIAAGMLAWRAVRQSDRALPPGSLLVTRYLVLGASIIFLLANVLWSPWLNFIAFLVGVIAALWGLGGKPLCRAFAPVIFMLVIILPPPLNGDETLTLWLRTVATKSSCALLDSLGVVQVEDGNTIQVPGRTLFMEDACSGINSFVLCNAFCLFWFLWQRRPVSWLWIAFPATSIFVMGNILRITTCASAFFFWHLDLLSGWPHDIFGLVLLLGYCGLILSLDQLLVFFLVSPAKTRSKSPPPRPPTVSGIPSQPVLGFKYSAVTLAAVGLVFFAAHLPWRDGPGQTYGSNAGQELDLTMPANLGGWHRINSNFGDLTMVQTLGIHSRSWQYESSGIVASLAVDYPLDGFHDVSICYVNSGWQVRSTARLLAGQDNGDVHATRLALEKNQQNAVVFHSVIDAEGNWLSKPKALGDRFIPTPTQAGYRIQLISPGDGGGYVAISQTTESQLAALYLSARQILVPQIINQLAKTHNK